MKALVEFGEVKGAMDEWVDRFNTPGFIESDPVSIPHRYQRKEDREIAALLTATIAWGNRKAILTNAERMMLLLDDDPFAFVLGHSRADLRGIERFVHRTFCGEDLAYFIRALKNIYDNHGGLEMIFTSAMADQTDPRSAISHFRKIFFEKKHPLRTRKHVSDPDAGSAAKRLNLFLRWMVRRDDRGVDFGIWRGIPMSALSIPLDLHSGRVARELGILTRSANDWKAVSELDSVLRSFDPIDPVRYDFALFGMGVQQKIVLAGQ